MSTSTKPENVAVAKVVALESLMVRPGHNPRTIKDNSADFDLIQSVKQSGILQPPLVRAAKEPGKFYIVAGHRRVMAGNDVGIKETLCLCLPWRPEAEIAAGDLVSAIVENLHRKALDPLERARAFDRLRRMGMSQREISKAVGVTDAHVHRELGFLTLPASVQTQITTKELSKEAARPLVELVQAGTPTKRITAIANECAREKAPEYVVREKVRAEKTGTERQAPPAEIEIYWWARTKYGSVDKALMRLRELEGEKK
jgi:ParB family chromosome partitioning protein